MSAGDGGGGHQSRPRGEPREQAIVAATLELLAEVGYERITMDAVAARAHASKATIYRRWSGKPELVVDAMRAHVEAEPLELPETGDLRSDLLQLLRSIRRRFTSNDRRLMLSLVSAAERDPEFAALRRAEIAAQQQGVRELIARGVAAAGVVAPDLDLIAELGPSQLIARLLLDEPVDDAYLQRLVDEVLVPLLTRTTESARSR